MDTLNLRTSTGKCRGEVCAGRAYRIAHGYFDINLDVVWDTVQTALPELLEQLN